MKQIKTSIGLPKILVCLLLTIIISKQAYSQANDTIKNVNWTNGAHTVSVAGKIISPDSSSNPVEITDSAQTIFISGSEITLKPGFHAGGFSGGGYFEARVDPCNLLQASVASTDITCYGGTGTATVAATGGTPPYVYTWSPTEVTDSTAAGLSAGIYTVTVTDHNGCTATAGDTLTEPTALTASIASSTNISCNGGNNGSVTLDVSGGTGPYTYSWSPFGGDGATATALSEGTYTVTATDANNCSASAEVALAVIPCGSACDLVGDGDFSRHTTPCSSDTVPFYYGCVPCWSCSHGTPQIGYDSIGGQKDYYASMWASNAQYDWQGEGIYDTLNTPLDPHSGIIFLFHIKYRLGSQSRTGTEVDIHADLTTKETIANSFYCDGSGGRTPPNPSVIYPIATLNDADSLWKDYYHCMGGADITHTNEQVLWIHPTTTDSLAWINVDDINMLKISANLGTTLCTCDSATIAPDIVGRNCTFPENIHLSYLYSWNSGGTLHTDTNASLKIPPAAITYSLTITVSYPGGSCNVSSSIVVSTNCLSVNITPPTNQICSSADTATFATDLFLKTGYLYKWYWGHTGTITDSSTASSIKIPKDTGYYYTVIVTVFKNGCTASASLEFHWLGQNALLVLASVACLDSNRFEITATAYEKTGPHPYTYQWYKGDDISDSANRIHGATADTVIVFKPGVYSIAVDDSGDDCTGIRTITIDSFDISLNKNSVVANCTTGGNVRINVSNPALGPYTFDWSPPTDSIFSGRDTSRANNLKAGTYIVTVRDSAGCYLKTKTIVVGNGFTLTESPGSTLCYPFQGTASVTVHNSAAPSQYQWYDHIRNDSLLADTTSLLNATIGIYKVVVKSGNYCLDSAYIPIDDTLGLIIKDTIFPSKICLGDTSHISLTVTNGDSLIYQWAPGTTLSDSAIANPYAVPLSTSIYTVTVTASNGCIGTATLTDTVLPLPQVKITPDDTTVCQGSLVTLHAGGALSYVWSTAVSDTLDSVTVYPPNFSDTSTFISIYIVTGRDSMHCSAKDTATITAWPVLKAPTLAILSCDTFYIRLLHDSSGFGGTPPYRLQWFKDGAPISSVIPYDPVNENQIHNLITTGSIDYYCTISDTNGCSSSSGINFNTETLQHHPVAIVINPPNGAHCTGFNNGIILNASGASGYVWSTLDTTASVNVLTDSTAIFTVTGTNSYGCTATATATITVNDTCCTNTGGEITYPNDTLSGTYSGSGMTLNSSVVVPPNRTVTFSGLDLYIDDGVVITVDSGATLVIDSSSHLQGCHYMWTGIVVLGGGTLLVANSTIEDAQYAVEAQNNSKVLAFGATFKRDYVGVYVPPGMFKSPLLSISGCSFTCPTSLTHGYANQTPSPLTHTLAGIYLNDLVILTLPANTFSNLNHGIYAINSNLTVNGGSFTNIQAYDAYGSVFTPYPGDPYGVFEYGAGIYARGTGSRSLTFTGNGSSVNFNNCGYGIYTQKMNATIHKAKITNLINYGIRIDNGAGLNTNVSGNTISTGTSGSINEQAAIYLYLNTATISTKIDSNYITMQNPNVNGSYGIHVAGYPASSPVSSITGNTIYMANAKRAFGITFSAAELYAAFNNDIYLSKATPLSNAAYGIFAAASPSINLGCNHISGQYAYGQTITNENTSGRYGIYTSTGTNYYYKCNSVDSTYDGIFYQDGFSNGFLSSNDIYHHQYGLDVNSNGYMAQQNWKGNKWHSSLSYKYAAQDLNPNFRHDLFKVNNSTSNIYFPPNLPNGVNPMDVNWFKPALGTDSTCGSILYPYCPPILATEFGTSVGYGIVRYKLMLDATDSLIARDSIHTINFDEQISWSAKRYLMEELLANDSLITQDSAVTAFYTAHVSDNIGALSSVRFRMDTLHNLNSATIAAIQNNLDTIYSNINTTHLISASLDTVYSGGGIMSRDSLFNVRMAVISAATAANDSIYAAIQSIRNTRVDAIKSENNALSSSLIYEQNEIAVNNIYLSTVAIGRPDSIITYSTQLYAISRQCALAGGDAVLLARILYAAINDSVFFDDNQICGSPNDTCLVPLTPNPISGKVAGVCGLHLNYTIDSVAGATGYIWSIVGDAVIDSGQGSTGLWVTFTDTFATGTISVYATDSCGSGNPATIAITGFPVSPASISGPSSLCAFAFGTAFSIDSVESATSYTWVVPTGCTIDSGQGTRRIVVDWDNLPGNVIVVASNACGTSDSTVYAVNIIECRLAQFPHSIISQAASGDVKMYPNPTRGNVTMIYHLTSEKGILQLFDITGRLLNSYNLDGSRNRIEFDIADLCCGVFEYRVLDNNSIASEGKLIIIR